MSNQRSTVLQRRFFAIAGCLVVLLLIVGLMGMELLSLLSPAPPEESPELLKVRGSLRKLEAITAQRPVVSGEAAALDQLLIGGASIPPLAGGTDDPAAAGEGEDAILPRLEGILRVQNPDGKVHYLAMLGGKSLGVRGTINGYSVRKITRQGVVLFRDGREWPLAAPDGALTVRPY